jgi:hypothetical protein
MEMLLIYPVFLGMSVAVAELARQRGYSGRWWFLISTLLPIVSIFILFMLKKKERKPSKTPKWAEQQPTNDKVLFTKEGI